MLQFAVWPLGGDGVSAVEQQVLVLLSICIILRMLCVLFY